MKIYANLFLIPFILIIIFSVFSGFTRGSDSALVEELIRERTDILHKVYFQQIDPEKGEQLLYEIETQPLLASDIRTLRQFTDTDMDMIRDLEILVLEETSNLYGDKSYRSDILWYMKGLAGDYVQSVDYNILLKKSGDRYKLSEFTPIIP